MSDVSEVLLKGGPVALLMGVAVAVRYAFEGITAWRKSRGTEVPEDQPDAATATNAMLLDALHSERKENRSKDARIDFLETENGELRAKAVEAARQYQEEINALRSKIQEVTLQLEGLQTRIREGLPFNNPRPSPK